MRIGANLHLLSTIHTGIQHYIRALIPRLVAFAPQHEFILYGEEAQLPSLPAQTVQWTPTASPLRSAWRRVVWEQTVLPVLLRRQGVEVFFSPAFALPLRWKGAGVVVIHDLNFEASPQTIHPIRKVYLRYITRQSVRQADAIIAISRSTASEIIRRYGIEASKVEVIHYGLDAHFSPQNARRLEEFCRKRYGLPERFLLFVGTLEPRKNLLRLLEAYAVARSQADLCPLVLVGAPSWQHQRIRALAVQLGIAGQIFFAGYIPHEHLPGVYAAATALLYPSLYEGFGLPPLEAMGCGTPVLASNCSAMPEVVAEAAVLVDPYDVNAIAQGIARVATDSKLRQQLITVGLRRARDFSWDEAAEQTLRVIESVPLYKS